MRNLFSFSLILCSFLLITSCGDDLKFDYTVAINMPTADDKNVDDVMHIHVDFESKKGEPVHHVNVKIYNKDSNEVVYDKPVEAHVHAENGTHAYHDDFDLSNANGVTEHTDWILEAKVWGDGAGVEEVIETVEFHVHP